MILALFVCRLFCFSLLAVFDRSAARVFLILSTTGHLSLFPLLFRPQGEVSSDYWIPLIYLFIYFTSVPSTKWSLAYKQTDWEGWPSGERTCLSPMLPERNFHTRRHMWFEFVTVLCTERFFPGYSGFLISSKTNIWLDLICWTVICKIVIWTMLISCIILLPEKCLQLDWLREIPTCENYSYYGNPKSPNKMAERFLYFEVRRFNN